MTDITNAYRACFLETRSRKLTMQVKNGSVHVDEFGNCIELFPKRGKDEPAEPWRATTRSQAAKLARETALAKFSKTEPTELATEEAAEQECMMLRRSASPTLTAFETLEKVPTTPLSDSSFYQFTTGEHTSGTLTPNTCVDSPSSSFAFEPSAIGDDKCFEGTNHEPDCFFPTFSHDAIDWFLAARGDAEDRDVWEPVAWCSR